MTMRRPPLTSGRQAGMPAPDTPSLSSMALPIAVWYVAIIAVLLLIAAGIYIVFLLQQRLQWQEAATQMSVGQELLQADRDELLQKTLDHEADLTALEQEVAARDRRLASLQAQRTVLQATIAGFEQDLADAERRSQERPVADEPSTAPLAQVSGSDELDQAISDRDAMIDQQGKTIKRLQSSLSFAEERLAEAETEAREKTTRAVEASLENAVLDGEIAETRQELIEIREGLRRGQVIDGHRASLGEVKPYQVEVGPEYWQVIEGWLREDLQRDIPVPDLSTMGWSYEGARLLVRNGGAPMVMLLYADQEGRPISYTIAEDASGDMPRVVVEQAGLNLLEWRDESHAFVLAGEADEVVLQVVASALQDQSNKVASDNPVPFGRFFRPEFKPETL